MQVKFKMETLFVFNVPCLRRGNQTPLFPPPTIIFWFGDVDFVRVEELLKEGKFPDAPRYYEFLSNKIILKFLPRYPDQMVKEEFLVTLSRTMKYEQVWISLSHLHHCAASFPSS